MAFNFHLVDVLYNRPGDQARGEFRPTTFKGVELGLKDRDLGALDLLFLQPLSDDVFPAMSDEAKDLPLGSHSEEHITDLRSYC